MATLLYLFCWLLRRITNTDQFAYDTIVFSVLLGMDGPGYLNTWRLWRINRT